jgi:hypothetical protein
MRQAIAILLLLAVPAGFAARASKEPHVNIIPITQGDITMFAVTVQDSDADEVVVQVCYWTPFPALTYPNEIVRCQTSVVPAISQGGAATDSVNVPFEKIHSVKVRLVKDLYEKKFPYKDKP